MACESHLQRSFAPCSIDVCEFGKLGHREVYVLCAVDSAGEHAPYRLSDLCSILETNTILNERYDKFS